MEQVEVIIKIQVGDRTFVLDAKTALRSRVIRTKLEAEVEGNRLRYVIAIEGDPDIFVHVWKYLVNDTFPLHYDTQVGHDYALYASIQQVAKTHGLTQLHDYLANQMYLQAVQITTTVDSLRDCQSLQYSNSANEDYEHVPHWISRKSYVCPRGIAVHMGHQQSCGKECEKKRGNLPIEFEDIVELVIMRIKKVMKFDASVLFPIPPRPGEMQG